MTGLDTIPSFGFDPSSRLRFHHPNPVDEYDSLPYMPYTNACANILTVPVLSGYDLFKECISSAVNFCCVLTNA